jgi:hypothetical protein
MDRIKISVSYLLKISFKLLLISLTACVVFVIFKLIINRELKNICTGNNISTKDVTKTDLLLRLGANPNQMSSSSLPLLFDVSCGFGVYHDYANRAELLGILLKHGADPNIRDYWADGDYLLAWGLKPEIEKELLKYGADPTLKQNGVTIVELLKKHGHLEDARIVQEAIEIRSEENPSKQ